MELEEKVQFLGESLIALNERVNKLCAVLKVVNQFHRDTNKLHEGDIDAMRKWADDCVDWLEGNLENVEYKYKDILQMRNELTYIHNELIEVKRLLGMIGEAPKITTISKGKQVGVKID